MKSALAAVALVAVAVVLAVGGWQLGWWLNAKNANKQVQINNRQQGTQEGWRDTVLADLKTVALLDPNDPRRGAVVDEACGLIPRLTTPYRTASIDAFESQECA